MGRRGYSTSVGKFAKAYHDRQRSEIRIFGELLRREQASAATPPQQVTTGSHHDR